tara:strand:+ start:382 stop:696 length:315 start_codon:yes stop_codon:yes gene_type:complete
MAVIRQRNKNQFKKVYPGIRKKPVYENLGAIEGGVITYATETSQVYTFNNVYTAIPAVVASPYDSAGNGQSNINLWVSAISTTSVTISTSSNYTGSVYVQVVEV